jgi:hypothetical protein
MAHAGVLTAPMPCIQYVLLLLLLTKQHSAVLCMLTRSTLARARPFVNFSTCAGASHQATDKQPGTMCRLQWTYRSWRHYEAYMQPNLTSASSYTVVCMHATC